MSEFKVCQFSNNLVQAYFADNSCLSWQNNDISYISNKGIKNKVYLQDLISIHNPIKSKLSKIIQKCNLFNDQYWIDDLYQDSSDKERTANSKMEQKNSSQEFKSDKNEKQRRTMFKKYKIKEFVWDPMISKVKQTEQGYQLQSQDRSAKVTLTKDLYLIRIEYLQLLPGKKVNKTTRAKQLLQKYNPMYTQLPFQSRDQVEFQYQYQEVHKLFSIFSLPQRWYLPMHCIWQFILTNKLAKEKFCYIDLEGTISDIQQNYNCTMPDSIRITQKFKNDHTQTAQFNHTQLRDSLLPIYGKPTNAEKCIWVSVGKQNSQKQHDQMISWHEQISVMFDGVGFWFLEGNSLQYRKHNKEGFDNKFHINATPLTIRFENQPERQIKKHLIAFFAYQNHTHSNQENRVLQANLATQSKSVENNGQICIVHQQNIEQIGVLKAYSNKMVVGNFIDKSMVTLKGTKIKILGQFGDTVQTSLQSSYTPHYRRYKNHIQCLTDFHERTFHVQEWRSKKLLQADIYYQNEATKLFLESVKID